MKRLTVTDLQQLRDRGQRITMLTAYDYPMARLADDAGVDVLLVGDSLGMVVLGYDSTLPVTVDDMVRHGAAVVRGSAHAHVVVDMPFGSYQSGWRDAMQSAVRILQETGAGSVKLEGGQRMAPTVRRLVQAGIPVMGHIGLTPQSVNQLGGFKLQGKTPRDAVRLVNDARALEEAGAYAIVLETLPARVAAMISDRVSVPTIGIGAGPYCTGQVQVLHDLLGLYDDFVPKHARQFMPGAQLVRDAISTYAKQVRSGAFPTDRESFNLDGQTRSAIDRAREMMRMPNLDHEGCDAAEAFAEYENSLIQDIESSYRES